MNKILLSLILLFFIICVKAQTIYDPYNFTIKPGSEQWKKFQTRGEMADALQIPPAILKNLTTAALARTCLNFPMFKDLYFFNDIQTGFNTLKQSFNGFTELLTRKDAATELIKIYKQMNPTNIDNSWNDTLKGDFTFQFIQIEMLLAQDSIINKLPEKTKAELVKESAKKYELKKATNQFSGFALSPSALIIGRILDKENKLQNLKSSAKNGSISRFLSTGTADSIDLLEQIWLLSKN